MKKLKPTRRKKPDKHEGWAHPFGRLTLPQGAVVHDGGWPCRETHEGEDGDQDYMTDYREGSQA